MKWFVYFVIIIMLCFTHSGHHPLQIERSLQFQAEAFVCTACPHKGRTRCEELEKVTHVTATPAGANKERERHVSKKFNVQVWKDSCFKKLQKYWKYKTRQKKRRKEYFRFLRKRLRKPKREQDKDSLKQVESNFLNDFGDNVRDKSPKHKSNTL